MSLESQKVFSSRSPDKGRDIVPVRSNDIARYSEDEAKAIRVREIWMASAMADLAKSEGHKKTKTKDTSTIQEDVYNVIKEDGPLSRAEIAEIYGVDPVRVSNALSALCKKGAILAYGPGNAQIYKLEIKDYDFKKPYLPGSSETRRNKILKLIDGQMTGAELSILSGIASTNVFSDLAIMVMDGLVEKTKRGNVNVYTKVKSND